MKLKRLIRDIPIEDVKGSREFEITGVCSNSKLVAPGNLFIAKKGMTVDGSRFIPEAIEAGASAILTDFADPSLKQVTQIIHHDVASIEPLLAAQYNHHPSDQLLIAGITGTNGKTTTAYLVKQLFDTLRGPCGLIGTIEYLIGDHAYRATHTTPDVATNHKLLREMVNCGCRSAVMEVTSHALEQGRVEQVHFDIGIFTNLTQEHLDYHKTMENYCAAKNKLFRKLNTHQKKRKMCRPSAIINRDDPYADKIIEGCGVKVYTYGIESNADIMAKDIHLGGKGIAFTLAYQGEQYPVTIPLIGRYNVYNSLATIGAGLSQGYTIEEVSEALKGLTPVPGRLEAVPNPLGLKIYVDFAHTPDALKNVLSCIREFSKRKVIVVFGCGGDRDKTKRPMMAAACEAFADFTIVTTDNPRTEAPESIIDEIVTGFQNSESFHKIVDRREAIRAAVEMATPDDIILIAGKGHETYQIFSTQTVEFDDKIVAQEVCSLGV